MNTKFFHISTIIRRRRNHIDMLKDDEGRWISNAQELDNLAIEYYKRLYSLDDVDAVVEKLPREGFMRLSYEDQAMLRRPFLAMEVEAVLRSMGKFKAPGPDEYQPIFYQQCWDVFGESVCRFVLEFFET